MILKIIFDNGHFEVKEVYLTFDQMITKWKCAKKRKEILEILDNDVPFFAFDPDKVVAMHDIREKSDCDKGIHSSLSIEESENHWKRFKDQYPIMADFPINIFDKEFGNHRSLRNISELAGTPKQWCVKEELFWKKAELVPLRASELVKN